MKHKLLIGDHGYATILSASIVAAVVSLAVVACNPPSAATVTSLWIRLGR